MGKPQEKKSKKGRDSSEKLHREELEKNRDKSAASLKGALIYRKKVLLWNGTACKKGRRTSLKLLSRKKN